MLDNIRKGMQDFSNMTFFPPNWLKCSLITRTKIDSYVNSQGYINETGLKVIVDLDMDDDVIRIGMGQGPTYSEVKI